MSSLTRLTFKLRGIRDKSLKSESREENNPLQFTSIHGSIEDTLHLGTMEDVGSMQSNEIITL